MANSIAIGIDTAVDLENDNAFINGDMRVNQRGTLPKTTVVDNTYYSDRWKTRVSGGIAGDASLITASQPTDLTGSSSLKYICTTAGTGNFGAFQLVEDFGLYAGVEVTLSAYIKSNDANARIQVHDGVGWSSSSPTHTGGGAWERISLTFTPSASATQLACFISIAGASGAGVGVAISDYIEFTGAKFELGSVATGFQSRKIGAELSLCQRYAQKTGGGATGLAQGTTTIKFWCPIQVPMRVAPSVSLLTTTPSAEEVGVADRTGAGSTLSGGGSRETTGWRGGITGFSSLTNGNVCNLGGDYILLDAEL